MDKYEEVFLRALRRRLPDYGIRLLLGSPRVAVIEVVGEDQIHEMSGHWRGPKCTLRGQVNVFVNAIKLVFKRVQ